MPTADFDINRITFAGIPPHSAVNKLLICCQFIVVQDVIFGDIFNSQRGIDMGIELNRDVLYRLRFVLYAVMAGNRDNNVIIAFMQRAGRNGHFIVQPPFIIGKNSTREILALYMHDDMIARLRIFPFHMAGNPRVAF